MDMRSQFRTLRAACVALGLLAVPAAAARADFAYGFATQTISGLTLNPNGAVLTPSTAVTTSSTSASTYNGSGISNSDVALGVDALQAFSGPAAPAPQNLFAKYATFGGGSPQPAGAAPTGPGEFGRGDSLISGLGTPANSGSAVGEAYMTTAGESTGNGGYQASLSFSLSTATSLAISYNFSNDIFVSTSGLAAAQAAYSFNIVIKTAAGAVVFNSTTNETNVSLVAPPQGGEAFQSGNQTVSAALLGGVNYTLIISGGASAAARVRAVPEPGSFALMGIGVGAMGMFLRRRMAGVTA